ncbi:hypothetical protein A1D31_27780 [Bradyrhizobium liaoningense]|nr:hypothetical protein A1D31_27780 [Bradyrhizobium liaoningense]
MMRVRAHLVAQAYDLEKVDDGSRIQLAFSVGMQVISVSQSRPRGGEVARHDVLRMTHLKYDPSVHAFGLQASLLALARHVGDTGPEPE